MSDPNPDDEAARPTQDHAPDQESPVVAARKLAELLAKPLAPVIRPAAPGVPPVRLDPPYRPADTAASTQPPPAAANPPASAPQSTATTPTVPSPAETPAALEEARPDVPPPRRDVPAPGAAAVTGPIDKAQAPDAKAPEVPPGANGPSRPDARSGEPVPTGPAADRPAAPDHPVAAPSAAATPDLAPPATQVPTPREPAATEPPLDPDAARLVGRVRRMMLVSSLTTVVAVAGVFVVIGYRVFKSADRAPLPPAVPQAPVEATLTLPQGARIIQTAVAENLLVVSLDVNGAIEIRTYDLKTLKPAGRMSFTGVP